MKPHFVFIPFVLLCFSISAQENILTKPTSSRSNVFILDSSRIWVADTTKSWFLYTRLVYTYDENQNIITETERGWDEFQNWADIGRNKYTYDSSNNLIAIEEQRLEGGVWKTDLQTLHSYNNNGDRTLELHQFVEDTVLTNYFQYVYTYDDNHHELTSLFQIWFGSDWNTGTLSVNTYDVNDRLSIRVNQKWISGSWKDDFRSVYLYDTNSNLDTLLDQDWNQFAWVDDDRSIYDYDENHNLTFRLKQNSIGIGAWENEWKEEYTYDEFDHVTHLIGYLFENDNWVPWYQYNFINDNNQNLSSKVHQGWQGGWNDQDSTQYYYTHLTGVHTLPDLQTFILFPNPAYDQLNIEFENSFDGHISVYNIQGVMVIDRKIIGAAPMRLDVASWQPGQYVIVLRNENGIVAKAFQKF